MQNKRGFTVLELMVGIIIFTLGFLGAYLLIHSATNASIYSRDEIIGANIMREQIELLKNLRDTNWIQFRAWDSIELSKSATEPSSTLQANNFYIISNNYTDTKPLHIEKFTLSALTSTGILEEFKKTDSHIRLCIDNLGRYTHDCTGGNQKTNYGSFMQVESLVTADNSANPITVDKSYKVTVYFLSLNATYRLTSMSTIITDWKNQ